MSRLLTARPAAISPSASAPTTSASNTAANQFSANRAFVQFAGITAGITQSFYDYYSAAGGGLSRRLLPSSDTGDPGWLVFGYTAQLGNGLSATLSMEQRRTTQIINAGQRRRGRSRNGNTAGYAERRLYDHDRWRQRQQRCLRRHADGDIVANLRLDQAWGGAQVMGAVHEVNANYYTLPPLPASRSSERCMGLGGRRRSSA